MCVFVESAVKISTLTSCLERAGWLTVRSNATVSGPRKVQKALQVQQACLDHHHHHHHPTVVSQFGFLLISNDTCIYAAILLCSAEIKV